MTVYIGIAHKDEDSDFGMYFPDLPGCYTAGSTMDELQSMALDALATHADALSETGKSLPAPSSVEAIRGDADVLSDLKDGAMLVQVPLLSRSKVKQRVEFQMDKNLVDAFDRRARALGLTRKALAEEAFEQLLRNA